MKARRSYNRVKCIGYEQAGLWLRFERIGTVIAGSAGTISGPLQLDPRQARTLGARLLVMANDAEREERGAKR